MRGITAARFFAFQAGSAPDARDARFMDRLRPGAAN